MKKFLAVTLCVLLCATFLPVRTFAASPSVTISGITLNEGENTVGEGTITFDSANCTLTLENVVLTEYIYIELYEEFTVVVKGGCSIGASESEDIGTNIWMNGGNLKITLEENAALSLYSSDGNNIYVNTGSLEILGPGKLTAETEGGYPSICVNEDITVRNASVEVKSHYWNGIYSEKGNITVENSDLTVEAAYNGIFASAYDYENDDYVSSSITFKNSSVKVTTDNSDIMYAEDDYAAYADNNAVFCGFGDILIENTTLETKVSGSSDGCESEGYNVYSGGNITITGENTVVKAESPEGIYADDGILNIEDGDISATATGIALFGRNGVTISGGTVNAASEEDSAISAREGLITITGDDTKVFAESDNADVATVRNVWDGGMSLDAYISAENTAGGKPFEGVKNGSSVAIEIGEGFNVGDYGIYMEEQTGSHEGCTNSKPHIHSWFTNADGTPVTGKVVVSKNEPDPVVPDKKPIYRDTVTIEVGGSSNQQNGEENPSTGAPVLAAPALLGVLAAVAFVKHK